MSLNALEIYTSFLGRTISSMVCNIVETLQTSEHMEKIRYRCRTILFEEYEFY